MLEVETAKRLENRTGSRFEEDYEWYEDDSEFTRVWDEAPRATQHLADDDRIEITPVHQDEG